MAKQRYAIVKVECPAKNEIDGSLFAFRKITSVADVGMVTLKNK